MNGKYAGRVEMVELNMFTAGRARARLSAMPTGLVLEINSGTGLSLCLKARARVHAVNIEKNVKLRKYKIEHQYVLCIGL